MNNEEIVDVAQLTAKTRLCKCGKDATFIKDYWVLESKVQKDKTYEETISRSLENNCGILRRRYCNDCISKIAAQQRRFNSGLNRKITVSCLLPLYFGVVLSAISYFVMHKSFMLITFIAVLASSVLATVLLATHFGKSQGTRRRIEQGKYDNLKDIEILMDSLNFGLEDYKKVQDIPSVDVIVDGEGRVNYEMERSGYKLRIMLDGKVSFEAMRMRMMYPFKGDAEYIKRTYTNAGLFEDNIKSIEAKELTAKDFDVRSGALLRYSGFATEVLIPEDVTKIGYQAFKNSKNCEKIVMPDTVCEIEKEAFMGCPATEITIPVGVKAIKPFTFYRSALKEIVLPEGVEIIDNSAFCECFSLERVVVPSSCKRIGENAFKGCTALTEVVLNEGLESIADYGFNGCTMLKSISVPDGCMEVGNFCFENCQALETVELPDTIQFIGGRVFDGALKMTIYGSEGSFAEQYATQQRVRFARNDEGRRYKAPKSQHAKAKKD